MIAPVTFGTDGNVKSVPVQVGARAVILPTVGLSIIVTLKALLLTDPQALIALTLMLPPVEPVVTLMLLVVEPVEVQPAGNVHSYDVAPLTALIEYVWLEPAQTVVSPVIAAGVAGKVLTVIAIASEVASELPDTQASLEVIMQTIWSPVASVLSEYVAEFCPTGSPFFCH